MSYFRDQLENWLKSIEIDVEKVLDVGGGDQSVKKRLKSFNAKEYVILDHDARFKPDFFADLNYKIELIKEEGTFDALFCLEVYEYIWNPVIATQNLYSFLKDDGVAYISFPTIYPLHNPPGIDYMRYTKNAIEKLLGFAGFKTWEITPRVATLGVPYLKDFYQVEGMHPLRGTMDIYDIGYLVKAIK